MMRNSRLSLRRLAPSAVLLTALAGCSGDDTDDAHGGGDTEGMHTGDTEAGSAGSAGSGGTATSATATDGMDETSGPDSGPDTGPDSGDPTSCIDDEWVCGTGCCSWSTEIVDADGTVGQRSALAMQSDGTIHVAYRIVSGGDSYYGGVRRAVGTSGAWTTHEVSFPSGLSGWGISVAVQGDKPWITEYAGSTYVNDPDWVQLHAGPDSGTVAEIDYEWQRSGSVMQVGVTRGGAVEVCYPALPDQARCVRRQNNGSFTPSTSDRARRMAQSSFASPGAKPARLVCCTRPSVLT